MSKSINFITKASKIHNNFYDYSLVEYINYDTQVDIICPIHGEFKITPRTHISNQIGCRICGKLKRTKTNMEKYGVEHPSQLPETQDKRKKTNMEKYGVEHPSQSNDIQKKTIQTNIDRYGVEYTTQSTNMKEKAKNTKNIRYDDAYYNNNIKRVSTCLQKYGVTHPLKHQDIKDKIKQTNLEKYGHVCSIGIRNSLGEFGNTRRQTNFERYGTYFSSQGNMIDSLKLLEDYDWLYDQYIIQNKTSNLIATELNVNSQTVLNYLHSANIQVRQHEWYSYVCIFWLNLIMEQENINIQHALNGGEYKIPGTKYKVDGYCAETNTIYEFHGDYWHGNPDIFDSNYINVIAEETMGNLYEKTIKRDQHIRELGYNLIVIWEYDFYNQQRENNVNI